MMAPSKTPVKTPVKTEPKPAVEPQVWPWPSPERFCPTQIEKFAP